jgi:hypothetical protein
MNGSRSFLVSLLLFFFFFLLLVLLSHALFNFLFLQLVAVVLPLQLGPDVVVVVIVVAAVAVMRNSIKAEFVCFAGHRRHPCQFFVDNSVFGKNGLCRSAEPRRQEQQYE